MDDVEIQFRAEAPASLVDAIRDALGAQGRPPSRRRVAAWIQAGRVRVDESLATDPRASVPVGARIDLRRGDEDGVAGPDGTEAPRTPLRILHLDRHLLVVEHEPLAVVAAGARGRAALDADLGRCLEAAGVHGLVPRPVPEPEPRAGGLLPAALSPAAAEALAASFASGKAHLQAEALVAGASTAGTVGIEVVGEAEGALHVRVPGAASLGAAAALLASRGLEVLARPGKGPAALRPLWLAATAVHLVHPRTGRRLDLVAPFPPIGSSP